MSVRLNVSDCVLLSAHTTVVNQNKVAASSPATQQRLGLIKYSGFIHSKQAAQASLKHYVGIELLEAIPGGHDGIIDGYQYFTCKRGHGIHVPLDRVVRKVTVAQLFRALKDTHAHCKRRMAQSLHVLHKKEQYIEKLEASCTPNNVPKPDLTRFLSCTQSVDSEWTNDQHMTTKITPKGYKPPRIDVNFGKISNVPYIKSTKSQTASQIMSPITAMSPADSISDVTFASRPPSTKYVPTRQPTLTRGPLQLSTSRKSSNTSQYVIVHQTRHKSTLDSVPTTHAEDEKELEEEEEELDQTVVISAELLDEPMDEELSDEEEKQCTTSPHLQYEYPDTTSPRSSFSDVSYSNDCESACSHEKHTDQTKTECDDINSTSHHRLSVSSSRARAHTMNPVYAPRVGALNGMGYMAPQTAQRVHFASNTVFVAKRKGVLIPNQVNQQQQAFHHFLMNAHAPQRLPLPPPNAHVQQQPQRYVMVIPKQNHAPLYCGSMPQLLPSGAPDLTISKSADAVPFMCNNMPQHPRYILPPPTLHQGMRLRSRSSSHVPHVTHAASRYPMVSKV